MSEGVCLQEDLVTIFNKNLPHFLCKTHLQHLESSSGCFHKLYPSTATPAPSVGDNLLVLSSPFWHSSFDSLSRLRISQQVLVLVVRRSNRALSQTPTGLQAELYWASSPET